MERTQFTFYKSFFDSVSTLAKTERLKVYEAICSYALLGIEANLSGAAAGMFSLMKPVLDASRKKAESRMGKQNEKKAETNEEESKKKAETNEEESENKKENKKEYKRECKKEKEKDIKKEIYKERKAALFAPPTPTEVEEYASGIGLNIDGQRFCDFYESKGWIVGKVKMKDWRAAARNWARRDRPASAPEQSREVIDAEVDEMQAFLESLRAV